MSTPEPLVRKSLSVSEVAHASVSSMQEFWRRKHGYRITQSEAVRRGMEALRREQENGQ